MKYLVRLIALLALWVSHADATQIYYYTSCISVGGWDTLVNLTTDQPPASYPCRYGFTEDFGFVYSNGTSWIPLGTGNGSVTSVSATVPSWLSVSVTNPTTTPSVNVAAAGAQTANEFVATPNGASGQVALRAIVAADLPSSITSSTSGNAATASALASVPTPCPIGQAPTGVSASGNSVGCTALFSGVGSPNTRSLSLATAYQATNSAKAAVVTLNLTSNASLTLAGGTTNTASVVVGSTSAVSSGTGTVVGSYANSLTGTLVVGVSINTVSTNPITFALPVGGYFAVLQTGGTVTISSAFDQSVG